jgi:hypothetical protein
MAQSEHAKAARFEAELVKERQAYTLLAGQLELLRSTSHEQPGQTEVGATETLSA